MYRLKICCLCLLLFFISGCITLPINSIKKHADTGGLMMAMIGNNKDFDMWIWIRKSNERKRYKRIILNSKTPTVLCEIEPGEYLIDGIDILVGSLFGLKTIINTKMITIYDQSNLSYQTSDRNLTFENLNREFQINSGELYFPVVFDFSKINKINEDILGAYIDKIYRVDTEIKKSVIKSWLSSKKGLNEEKMYNSWKPFVENLERGLE